jgi:hypothetical protein
MKMRCALAGLLASTVLTLSSPAFAQGSSVFPTAPAEPRAVTVKGVGDGKADDSDALQKALDEARDQTRHGMVFLPSGKYRITRTLIVPAGVRVYGVGRTRPVILLGANTPGFQQGVSTMLIFAGDDQYNVGKVPVPVPTVVPRDKIVRDANSGTFYSSMRNVDIEIGEGNPAAAGVRFRMAQHAFLSDMEFRLGSAFAGVYQAGNVIENVHFKGGRYGILTEKTSPAWQYTLLDSSFDGQRDAAIREHEAGLTMVNTCSATCRSGSRSIAAMATGCGARMSASRMSRRRRSSSATKAMPIPRSASTMRWPAARRCSRASATAARPSPGPAQALPGQGIHLRADVPELGQPGQLRDAMDASSRCRRCRAAAIPRSALSGSPTGSMSATWA